MKRLQTDNAQLHLWRKCTNGNGNSATEQERASERWNLRAENELSQKLKKLTQAAMVYQAENLPCPSV